MYAPGDEEEGEDASAAKAGPVNVPGTTTIPYQDQETADIAATMLSALATPWIVSLARAMRLEWRSLNSVRDSCCPDRTLSTYEKEVTFFVFVSGGLPQSTDCSYTRVRY